MRTHCLITNGKMVLKRETKRVVFSPAMVVWIGNRRRGRAFFMLLIMRATICRCDASNVIIFAHLFVYSSDCLLISHSMTPLIISLFQLGVYNDALYKAQQLERWYCVYRETALHRMRLGSLVLCYMLHIQGVSFCLYNRCVC